MADTTVSILGGVGDAALRYKDMCDGTKAEVVYVGGGTQSVTQSGVWTVGLTGAHVTIDNASIPVTGTFWPGTQPVSGTFWPATQPVSGTFWQTTQPVSGTVAVSNFPASQAVTGPLTDTQLRATAVPVSVGNFPATQPVSGTFWQATQPVSIVSLPALAAGSALIGKTGVDQTTPGTTNCVEEGGRSFSNIAANATTVVKSGAGVLRSITINKLGSATTATVYDNTSAAGTKIATVNTAQAQTTLLYDAKFSTGLTVVTAGTTAADITVVYR